MNPDDERAAFWSAVHTVDDRVTRLEAKCEERGEMTKDSIMQAVREAMPRAVLTEEQHRWVELAIQAQAERAALRKAIIEKSLLGLVWATIAGLVVMAREYAIAHGMWKP